MSTCTICEQEPVNPQVLSCGHGFCHRCITFNICPVCNSYIKFKIPNLALSGNPLDGKLRAKYPVNGEPNMYWIETNYNCLVDYLGEWQSRGLKGQFKYTSVNKDQLKCLFLVDDRGYIKGGKVVDPEDSSELYAFTDDI